jgi:hypothetical protein
MIARKNRHDKPANVTVTDRQNSQGARFHKRMISAENWVSRFGLYFTIDHKLKEADAILAVWGLGHLSKTKSSNLANTMSLFGKTRWGMVDCLTGDQTPIERFPFELGSAEGMDLRLLGRQVATHHCGLTRARGHNLCLIKREPEASLIVNGVPIDKLDLEAETEYSLQIGHHLLLLRGSKDLAAWRDGLNCNTWLLYNPALRAYEGPQPLLDLCRKAKQQQLDPECVLLPQGAATGFYLRQVLEIMNPRLREVSPSPAPEATTERIFGEARDQGTLTCPVCWLRFDLGDIMHVAVHDSLRGDPVLGQDAPLRFHATQFNDRGQALDAFGLPCVDIACPHCRRILPPGFLEMPHHIFSIVGDQSAGKSYYLSVLIKLLPVNLYRHFGVTFQDADPAGNALLNDMKKTLFSAESPEQARLVKTQLEGAMYERLPRYGRTVALPKPFVFSLTAREPSTSRCAAIFYDNAGEHFQPGRDSADSPGAQHVASSSGIVFLFDPFNNPDFRHRMQGHTDPQLERPVLDQQDVILSELKIRVKKLINLELGDKIPRPLAVVVGKCDAWMHWLGNGAFNDPVADGYLDLKRVQANSDLVRRLMLEVAPTVVANAEAISDQVMFFPVSSFGHPPIKIGSGDYVPDPKNLQPILADVPILWLLSITMPELIATS